MRNLIALLLVGVMLAAMAGTAAAEARMVLADTQQIPENRLFMGGYAAGPLEGKIIMSEIRGSKVSAKPQITFYAREVNGKSIKFELQFADGNIQVCALYDGGTHKGLLDRKYLLRETLPANDKWRYAGTFSLEVADGRAVITLGGKSYTWPEVSALTGEMQVSRVSGKLEVYNWVRD